MATDGFDPKEHLYLRVRRGLIDLEEPGITWFWGLGRGARRRPHARQPRRAPDLTCFTSHWLLLRPLFADAPVEHHFAVLLSNSDHCRTARGLHKRHVHWRARSARLHGRLSGPVPPDVHKY